MFVHILRMDKAGLVYVSMSIIPVHTMLMHAITMQTVPPMYTSHLSFVRSRNGGVGC